MQKILNPFVSLFFLICLGSGAYFFHLPEITTAILLLIYFIAVVFIHPANGINFLLLIIPFCLGDSKMPFYNGIEVFTYLIILSGMIHLFFKKELLKTDRYKFIAGLGTLIIFSNLLSFPLDPRVHWMLLKTSSFKDIISGILCPNEESPWYYFRALSNHLSAAGLFMITALFYTDADNLKKILKTMVFSSGILFALVWLIFFGWIKTSYGGENFLTLQLMGVYHDPPYYDGYLIFGFAYNQGYWGQYISSALPVCMALLLFTKIKLWQKSILFFILVAGILQIPYTYQRGPVLGIAAAFLLLSAYAFYLAENKKKILIYAGCIGLSALILFLFFDLFLMEKSIVLRLMQSVHAPELRKQVWSVAWQMIENQPLLGVGLGKFHYYFQYFCPQAGIPWEGDIRFVRSHAHNLYLHILAEQGIIGFFSWLAMLGTIAWRVIRSVKNKAFSFEIASLTGILTAFLAFGIGQYMMYLRVMDCLYWMLLGSLTCFISEKLMFRFTMKFYAGFFIIFGILLFWRLYSAWSFTL